jgi:pimeloyl-ACP methyl ester carboxylesterase
MRSIITKRLLRGFVAAALSSVLLSAATMAGPAARVRTPTIVLVHGAFADSSSWNAVIPQLLSDGYEVIAVANPLRGLASDSEYVAGVIKGIPGPVILVGHSYGGAVISNAGAHSDNVKALVYVAGLAPDTGESAFGLVGKFPGSTLGDSLATPVPLAGGSHDLYVKQAAFRAPVAADVPEKRVRLMAATQRPLTDSAGNDPSAEAAWKTLPSWFIYGSADQSIPPAVHAFMAERANSRHTQVVKGASHVVMVSHPIEVARMIREAATSVVASSP